MTADHVGPLHGVTVLDIATLFAGPLSATILGDYGAEVIKVEHPQLGDPARSHGGSKNGVPLWWKMLSRNKRAVTIKLGEPEGRDLFLRLVERADVVVENFRPGTLERWGLGYEELSRVNPRIVLARVTGFGHVGPMASEPGFGTLAEAMSGFAASTGEPDRPPVLPPFGLADGISALVLTFGIMAALRSREFTGKGQVVDVALIEPMLTILGSQPMEFDQLGIVPERLGNRTSTNAPRNTYRSADGVWLAVSASAHSVAERLLKLVGRPDFIDQEWFATSSGRAQHVDELDEVVGSWIAAREAAEVIAEFKRVEAAVAPVMTIAEIMSHPQFRALDTITRVEDEDFGSIAMQNVLTRLSDTPGSIRWTGEALGASNEAVFASLGYSAADIEALRKKGIV